MVADHSKQLDDVIKRLNEVELRCGMGETSLDALVKATALDDFHAPADMRQLRVNTTEQCGIDDVQDAFLALANECNIRRDSPDQLFSLILPLLRRPLSFPR